MLEPEGFEEIKKITWKEIEPGMIILSGLKVNDAIPHELKNYPALTVGQIYELTQKYHLRKDREILVATCKKGESPQKMSLGFSKLESKIKTFNEFRESVLKKRESILGNAFLEHPRILENPKILDLNFKVLNQFNSLEYKKKLTKQKYSLFHKLSQNITIGEVLSKTYKKKFLFPNEFSCNYFLGFAYDNNFKTENLKIISEGYELFYPLAHNVLEKSKISLFGFSEEVQEIKYPFFGREVENGKIFFSSFLKRVMHKKNKDSRNFALLCSFQPPNDFEELSKLGEKFSKAQIDLCFLVTENISSSLLKKVSESFNANCIILKDKTTFPLAFIEILDWYISEVSLQLEPIREVQLQEFSSSKFTLPKEEEKKKEKVIKPFEFKRIKKDNIP